MKIYLRKKIFIKKMKMIIIIILLKILMIIMIMTIIMIILIIIIMEMKMKKRIKNMKENLKIRQILIREKIKINKINNFYFLLKNHNKKI